MIEVRIGVIGVGRMGLTHAENLAHRVRGARQGGSLPMSMAHLAAYSVW